MKNRILFSDNGTLEEWTPQLSKYATGEQSFSFVAAEDAIYIGSLYPFNHKYFKFGSTVNAAPADMTISVWGGNEFEAVVNIVDETGLRESMIQ